MGDATTRELITTTPGQQGGVIRPILATSDPNVITVNGTVLSPIPSASGAQQWQTIKTVPVSSIPGGATTAYYPCELKVEPETTTTVKTGAGARKQPRIQTIPAGTNIIDVKNVTPLPQSVLNQVQANNASWQGATVVSAAPTIGSQPTTINLVNTDQGWSTIKWENAPPNLVQKNTVVNASGLQFVTAPAGQQLQNVVVQGGRKTNTIIETFKCEVCNQIFQSMGALQQHVTTIHEAPAAGSSGNKGKAGKKTFSPSTLHCEYKYSGSPAFTDAGIPGVTVIQQPQQIQQAVVQQGIIAPQPAPQPQFVVGKNGKIKKEKRRNWQCHICLNRFSRKDHLAKHVSAVHEKIRPFECGTCSQRFSQKHHLRAHMLARHEDDKTAAKAFACQLCAKRFTRNDHLERHIESVHEKRKQFECQVCAHQFARKHHLSKHILAVHAKVKPYGCHLCDQSFLQRHHLGAHIMSVHQPPVHEEEDGTKTYVCAICNHRFKRKDHLRIHVETVHEKARNYACQLCERRFGQKFHLAIHVSAVHEGKKPHACHHCSHKSARKSGLQRHLKTVHNIPPQQAQQQTNNVVQAGQQTQTIQLQQQPQLVQQIVQLQPQTIGGEAITVAVHPQQLQQGTQGLPPGTQVITTQIPTSQLLSTSQGTIQLQSSQPVTTQSIGSQPVTVTQIPTSQFLSTSQGTIQLQSGQPVTTQSITPQPVTVTVTPSGSAVPVVNQ